MKKKFITCLFFFTLCFSLISAIQFLPFSDKQYNIDFSNPPVMSPLGFEGDSTGETH